MEFGVAVGDLAQGSLAACRKWKYVAPEMLFALRIEDPGGLTPPPTFGFCNIARYHFRCYGNI